MSDELHGGGRKRFQNILLNHNSCKIARVLHSKQHYNWKYITQSHVQSYKKQKKTFSTTLSNRSFLRFVGKKTYQCKTNMHGCITIVNKLLQMNIQQVLKHKGRM